MGTMPRSLRFVPSGHAVEVTLRTQHGRLFLRPSRTATRTIAGVIGRAQRLYDMDIHAVVVMGNHLHLLASPYDAEHLARFMGYVGSNIARKIGKLIGWRERFWGRRYTAIVVSNEEAAQIARLRYLLAHSAKEGFVLSPNDWPGVHASRALTDGSMAIDGFWHDATAAYRDRLAGKAKPEAAYGQLERIRLAPLPCWSHLTPGVYRQRVEELVEDIEHETLERHRQAETAPTGANLVLACDPHEIPCDVKRSPRPAFHAASKEAWRVLKYSYRAFELAYREAAKRLRDGERSVAFPRGCFPPALPFVPG